MSWLARSIANSLKFDDDDVNSDGEPEHKQAESPDYDSSTMSPPRGVKEDLSEFSETLTRQFWGVASFLAPPPQSEQEPNADVKESGEDPMLGIRGDFAEIGGRFTSGISRLSNNINVSEITKMASNFLQLESDDESGESGKRMNLDSLGKEAIGVTEEVVAFARDISINPETWLDFPLPEIVGDDAEFDMSDAQQEHALAVERLAPELAQLRFDLCPAHMSDSNFWKIYFVLLHPRLEKQDAELLLTPQIVEARSLLVHDLKNRKATELENLSGKSSSDSEEYSVSPHEERLSVPPPVISEKNFNDTTNLNDNSTEKASAIENHPAEESEIQIEDKGVIVEDSIQVTDKQDTPGELNTLRVKDEDEADDWLQEEVTSEISGHAENAIAIGNDDDVSFSDLEDDDGDGSTSFRKSNYSSDRDSREWVQLGKSPSKSSKDTDGNDPESKESSDWLDIEDIGVP